MRVIKINMSTDYRSAGTAGVLHQCSNMCWLSPLGEVSVA